MALLKLVNRIAPFLFAKFPVDDRKILQLCQDYIDHFNGDNNSNFRINGELDFLRRFVPSCHVIFDVGANRGDWTTSVLQINSTAVIHCFEPSTATFNKLSERAFPQNVVLNNIGLGSQQAEMALYIFDEGSEINSLYQRRGLEAGWGLKPPELTETVHLNTLDQYCEDKNIFSIDFLKIDVEGHELEVLRGAMNLLRQGKVSVIQFEYGGCNIDSGVLLKDLFETLAALGYKLYKLHPSGLRAIDAYDQRLENFRYQNWIASLTPLVS